MHRALAALFLLGSVAASTPQDPVREVLPRTGRWHGELVSPVGGIPFDVDLARVPGGWKAWIVNGAEREAIRAEHAGRTLTLTFPTYDTTLSGELSADGRTFTGEWVKPRGTGDATRMAFTLRQGAAPRFPLETTERVADGEVAGRWRVTFEHGEDPAVGIFTTDGLTARGTFLTTLGDYRYLDGTFDGRTLQLSCFDGAHAFRFDAQLDDEGRLGGSFQSSDTWNEVWSAERDDDAALPDPFGLTTSEARVPLADLRFPDLDGEPVALSDPRLTGKARLLVLFGTWCPNCHDETRFLVELHQRFADRGLAVTGLAFEHEDAFENRAARVRRYVDHLEVPYPVLIAGPPSKAEASAILPFLDRVRAYPTTLFLDTEGRVHAVHTGFSGPATGPEHERLRAGFERLLEELLGASPEAPGGSPDGDSDGGDDDGRR